jgi:hypothetical protein
VPRIDPYVSNATPGGAIDAQASPSDFGAQIGGAMQNFGDSVRGVSDTILRVQQEHQDIEDVTNVHVNMAKARAEWTKNLADRSNAAQPGDDTFAPTLMKDMGDYFAKFSDSVKTKAGRKVFETLSANMTADFGVRAIGVESELAAKDAVNKYDLLNKSISSSVYQDQSQLDSAIAQGKAAIDDPKGMFSRVPQTTRDEFKTKLEQDANWAAAKGFVQHSPDKVLASMDPAMLEEFKPAWKILDSNVASGAKVTVSDATRALAPQAVTAAATRGVNPNVLLAQLDTQSAPNPVQQAASLSTLVTKYAGDYNKAVAASSIGTTAVDSLLSRWGDGWQTHLPTDAANYLQRVMKNSGLVADPNAPPTQAQPAVMDRASVDSSLPFLKGLTFQQQDAIVGDAVQLQNMRMSMAHRAQEDADYQINKQRDLVTNGFMQRIIDPKTHGGMPTDREIVDDTTLSWQEKQHLVDYKMQRAREQNEAANRSHPGEVRQLLLQIHAADNDPTKTYNMDPIMASLRRGGINGSEYSFLRQEVEQMRDGTGSNFGKMVQGAREKAYGTFVRSFEATLPGGATQANDAYYRFTVDLNNAIDAKRRENKDPSGLLTPGSHEYQLSPENLQRYWPSAASLMAQQARQAVSGGANDHTAAPGFVIGRSYKVNGKDMTYAGGATNLSTSWK